MARLTGNHADGSNACGDDLEMKNNNAPRGIDRDGPVALSERKRSDGCPETVVAAVVVIFLLVRSSLSSK